jgi:hypothetical protein
VISSIKGENVQSLIGIIILSLGSFLIGTEFTAKQWVAIVVFVIGWQIFMDAKIKNIQNKIREELSK